MLVERVSCWCTLLQKNCKALCNSTGPREPTRRLWLFSWHWWALGGPSVGGGQKEHGHELGRELNRRGWNAAVMEASADQAQEGAGLVCRAAWLPSTLVGQWVTLEPELFTITPNNSYWFLGDSPQGKEHNVAMYRTHHSQSPFAGLIRLHASTWTCMLAKVQVYKLQLFGLLWDKGKKMSLSRRLWRRSPVPSGTSSDKNQWLDTPMLLNCHVGDLEGIGLLVASMLFWPNILEFNRFLYCIYSEKEWPWQRDHNSAYS